MAKVWIRDLITFEKGVTRLEKFIDWVVNNKEWLFSGVGLVVLTWMGRLIYKKNFVSSSQTIRAGDSSTNIQAARDINVGTNKTRHDEKKR